MKTIKFIDLFAGVGGMRIALERSAFKNNISQKCVLSCEIDKRCREVYQNNFLDNDFVEDIKSINKKNIHKLVPDHDVLLAGFPCQPFSNAGVVQRRYLNRPHGFSDKKQGNLIFNVIEILRHKKPSAFILENVKNLGSHNKGRTLQVILKELRKDFYVPDPEILNAKDFGLPQKRERIYIIGFKKKKSTEFNYPTPTSLRTSVGRILEKKVSKEYTISDRLWIGHKNRKIRNLKRGAGFGYRLSKSNEPFTRTITSRYAKDGSECLIYQGKNKNPRFLTPRECFRLQGFPESFKISKYKTHAYQQAGNAVPVNVVNKICDKIFEYLFSSSKSWKKSA